MIDSVLDLVNKTTSNSLFMFLFCNFIIILILIGNSKPDSQHSSNPGLQKFVIVSDSVLSSKTGLISDPTLSSKPGIENSDSGLSSKPLLKSKPVQSSNPSYVKPVLISESNLTSKPGFQEPELISKSTISYKPGGSEELVTSKSGLKPGSGFSEKDEKGNLEENESEVECVLRRRVEEFIRKVNTQWKSENTRTYYTKSEICL